MADTPQPDQPLWMREFGPQYEVPDAIAKADGLVDCSWHNDTMPSFKPADYAEIDGSDIRLWVAPKDPDLRESPAITRLCVSNDLGEHSDFFYQSDDEADIPNALHVLREACDAEIKLLGGDKAIIERMKTEILDLVRDGRVPSLVKTFEALGDYIDPNELGGFTSDEHLTAMPQELLEALRDRCWTAVDLWLRAGDMARAFLASTNDKDALRKVARAKAAAHAEAIAQETLLIQAGQSAIYFTPDMTPQEVHDMKVWLVYMGLADWQMPRTGRML